MNAPSSFSAMTSPAPVSTAAQGEQLVAHFHEVMDTLVEVVQQETELVRAGHLSAATKLQGPKTDLTRLYIADTLQLRASHARLAKIMPEQLKKLRDRHETFRSMLQINLTVLATAHAVSEGIVRGVSGEMTRKAMPQTYGATGRATMPARNASRPLSVSRSL